MSSSGLSAVFGIVHVMFPAYLSKYMSSLIHTAVTWCVCVRTDGLFPSSLLVAAFVSSVTVWEQLVSSGEEPSALHENVTRDRNVTQPAERPGKVLVFLENVESIALRDQSCGFYL